MLRLELLSRAGLSQQILDESVGYRLYMAERTGTLWENDGAYASCNHGFASHAACECLYRDVLGLASVDTVNKTVQVRFTDLRLDRCEGSVPTPNGEVALRWRTVGDTLRYHVRVPPGYTVRVDNRSRRGLQPEP